MKILRLWIAVAVFSVLFFVVAALDAEAQQVAPNEVSARACDSPQQLVPLQDYCVQLTFNPAPHDYHGGTIATMFKQEEGPSPSTRYSGPMPRDSAPGDPKDLIDDQANYKIKFHVTEDLAPGKWKLVEVSLGNSNYKSIPILGDASFDILQPTPLVVHVDAPQSVVAGQRYNATVTVDEFPKNLYKDCVLDLGIVLKPTSPNAQSFGFDKQRLTLNTRSYTFSYLLAHDFAGGSLAGEVVIAGADNEMDHFTGCRYPELKGDTGFKFNIEPDKDLVTPTSVKVTVNRDQTELFKEEIARLTAKTQQLGNTTTQSDLRHSVEEAKDELDRTENTYKAKGTNPSFTPTIEVFFDDIRLGYDAALKTLADDTSRVHQTGPRLIYANSAIGGIPNPRTSVSNAVLNSFERNIAAYHIAILSSALTFDLEVRSEPEQDAAISYRRGKGKPFVSWPGRTNSTLQNRPRAFYTIRIQKSGYGDQCVDFDAMTDTSTTITIPLEHEDGCKQ
jgi:hypothetical protein